MGHVFQCTYYSVYVSTSYYAYRFLVILRDAVVYESKFSFPYIFYAPVSIKPLHVASMKPSLPFPLTVPPLHVFTSSSVSVKMRILFLACVLRFCFARKWLHDTGRFPVFQHLYFIYQEPLFFQHVSPTPSTLTVTVWYIPTNICTSSVQCLFMRLAQRISSFASGFLSIFPLFSILRSICTPFIERDNLLNRCVQNESN